MPTCLDGASFIRIVLDSGHTCRVVTRIACIRVESLVRITRLVTTVLGIPLKRSQIQIEVGPRRGAGR